MKYTTTQYAKKLGVSRRRVHQMFTEGKLNTDKIHAEKVGDRIIIEVDE